MKKIILAILVSLGTLSVATAQKLDKFGADLAKKSIMGLYRIGFTTYKTGEVQGSFLAQIGAPIKLPGVAIAAKAEDLMAAKK